jgi:5-methylcytosine-specific restriction endonuclease McrA
VIVVAEATATKICSKCGRDKPRAEFYERSRAKDGLAVWCKPCTKTYSAGHYRANRERALAQSAARFAANHVTRKAQLRAYYEAHKDEYAERQRKWNAANPGGRARLVSEWRKANPERNREHGLSRRAREASAAVGPIDLAALWTGSCGICGDPMDPDLKKPDLMRKSIDHIVPLAKGGPHAQGNLQWAHLLCNVRKGAKT